MSKPTPPITPVIAVRCDPPRNTSEPFSVGAEVRYGDRIVLVDLWIDPIRLLEIFGASAIISETGTIEVLAGAVKLTHWRRGENFG